MITYCVLLVYLSSSVFTVNGFEVSLVNDGPVIIGGTINFWAEVLEAYYDNFRYVWQDNVGKHPHSETIFGKTKSQWNVTYPVGEYEPGQYEVELEACEGNILNYYWPCTKKTVSFKITADLNGQFEVLQNNSVMKKPYVSNHTEVEHKIVLKDTDLNVLEENNFTVISFWLINCTYLGMTNDLTFRYNYTEADVDVTVKAIVVAAKFNETTNAADVLHDSSLTNGTSKAVNSTSEEVGNVNNTLLDNGKNINSTIHNILHLNATSTMVKLLNDTVTSDKMLNMTEEKVTLKPNLSTTAAEKQVFKAVVEKGKIINLPFKKDTIFTPWPDGSCNGSFIPKDPDKLYGYFHHVVKPRRPIQVQKVSANTWLKNGDLLNLTVTFTGSQPYHHCIQFISGEYNSTGNESCSNTQKTSTDKINIVHFFGMGEKHTVLVIIENNVSKTVTAVVVTNYIAKKHPQLSVVIVPISFIAIAIILIVFGVAYYIQSINRGPIEVADFDFSANNDTEYKSFKERLHEAFSSAFTRSNLEEDPEEGPSWSPSRNDPTKPQIFINPSDSE